MSNSVYKELNKLKSVEKLIIMLRNGLILKEPELFYYKNRLILVSSNDLSKDEILNKFNINSDLDIHDFNDGKLHNIINNFYYYRFSGECLSLKEVASIIGITHQRISQLEHKTYEKLKNKDKKNILKIYYE